MKKTFLTLITLLVCNLFCFEAAGSTNPKDITLYPQQNAYRNRLDLSGIWDFQKDPENIGESEGWFNQLPAPVSIAVPGSWNDQIDQNHNYIGTSWYQTESYIPSNWKGNSIWLRVGSAVYLSKVWINGELLGQHEGGHLPFTFDISSKVKWGEPNRIVIMVENNLATNRVPGIINGGEMSKTNFPATNYDFFPYSGLHRAVWIYSIPRTAHITDITCTPSFSGNEGHLQVKVEKQGNASSGKILLKGKGKKDIQVPFRFTKDEALVNVNIPDVQLWDTENPFLYEVTVVIGSGSRIVDSYTLNTGIRTISVEGEQLLLNGKPIHLRGFGKHEDFPIFGRGVANPVMIRDFSLMKWLGANSFRTSHYPYDESVYEEADRQGILIIDEMPSVGLVFFDDAADIERRQELCRQYLQEMIARDKNHPSVIMWSVANEPSPKNLGSNVMGGRNDADNTEAELGAKNLTELIQKAKETDPSRLAAFVGVMGGPADWMTHCDVLLINRYYGWYTNNGDFETAKKYFAGELEMLHNKFHKPIVITEFGADAIAGHHANENEMFSEEFQQMMINSYLDIANTKSYVSGMMVWAFADFRTSQALMRVAGRNLKGVFTQDRRPKMAAHLLKKRWVDEVKGNY